MAIAFLSPISRFQAAVLHLIGSLILAGSSIFLVFFVWYPGLMAYASNVTTIFLILLSVDITLGPLLTFVVFNPQKKELKRDLLIIVLIQIFALIYGLHTLFINRPVYLAYNSGRFDTVYAIDIKAENLTKAGNQKFKSLPIWGPVIIASPLPSNPEESAKIALAAISGKGDDVQYLPQYYVEYETQKASVIPQLKSLDALRSFNTENEHELNQLIEKYKKEKKSVGYVPLVGKGKFIVFIIDKANGDILEKSRLKPWP